MFLAFLPNARFENATVRTALDNLLTKSNGPKRLGEIMGLPSVNSVADVVNALKTDDGTLKARFFRVLNSVGATEKMGINAFLEGTSVKQLE